MIAKHIYYHQRASNYHQHVPICKTRAKIVINASNQIYHQHVYQIAFNMSRFIKHTSKLSPTRAVGATHISPGQSGSGTLGIYVFTILQAVSPAQLLIRIARIDYMIDYTFIGTSRITIHARAKMERQHR